jgi:hypothetical protein
VLLMLATRSYARAAQIDPTNATATAKLASVRKLIAPQAAASAP